MACSNCNALEISCDTRPAVPEGGSCIDILHVCPQDGQRWWQYNTHYHLWQKVDSEKVWEGLKEELRNPLAEDCNY